MRDYYVLCSKDCYFNRLVYYMGANDFHGNSCYGDVLEAKRFNTLEEVANLIRKEPSEFYLGVNVLENKIFMLTSNGKGATINTTEVTLW